MPSKVEIIEALKDVLSSDANIKIELAGEEFSTRLLALDEKTMQFTIDSIIPKYGDNFLIPDSIYNFDHSQYDAGTVRILQFSAGYKSPGDFNKLPAHIFGVPLEIHRKSVLFDIKPRPNDNISITYRYRRRKHMAKVTRLNIKNVYFNHSDADIKIDDSGFDCGDVTLAFQGKKLSFRGRMFKDTKYDFRMQIVNVAMEQQVELSAFIGIRYRALRGFRKLNVLPDQEKTRSVINIKSRKAIKAKLFIVDSEIIFTDLLSRSLGEIGYSCSIFNDSPGVVESAVRFKPDVIILETILPYYDGFTVLRRLKENPETSSIPVIMLSHSNNQTDVIDAKQIGAAHYLLKSKDKDIEELVEKLNGIINLKE